MFMPAHALYDTPSLDAAAYGGNVETMRKNKRYANARGKLASVEGGIRKPVQLAHGSDPAWDDFAPSAHVGPEAVLLANGNHRVTAAYDSNPDMEVPVEHYGDSGSLFSAMREQDRGKW
jgi:hypothetical protein